jgi:hypothetical protein
MHKTVLHVLLVEILIYVHAPVIISIMELMLYVRHVYQNVWDVRIPQIFVPIVHRVERLLMYVNVQEFFLMMESTKLVNHAQKDVMDVRLLLTIVHLVQLEEIRYRIVYVHQVWRITLSCYV